MPLRHLSASEAAYAKPLWAPRIPRRGGRGCPSSSSRPVRTFCFGAIVIVDVRWPSGSLQPSVSSSS
eukprot:3299920-Pyramimonas_sp.AAC.1